MKFMINTERIRSLLKCLLAAYFMTGVLLVVLSALLYKFSISEDIVEIGIIVIYCISSLLAGLFFAKGAKCRRFIWGALAGIVYFLIICIISAVMEPDFNFLSNDCLTTMFICVISGMLGGMFS